jgi:hypothetical protein
MDNSSSHCNVYFSLSVNDKESMCNRGYLDDETIPDKQVVNTTVDSEVKPKDSRHEITRDSVKIKNHSEDKSKKEQQRTNLRTPLNGNIKIKNWFKTSEFYMVSIYIKGYGINSSTRRYRRASIESQNDTQNTL